MKIAAAHPPARGRRTGQRLAAALAYGLSCALALAAPVLRAQGPAQDGGKPITAAERALFLEPSLVELKAGTALGYRFHREGGGSTAQDDRVTLNLAARGDGRCCAASVAYLSGAQQMALPEIDLAEANPVLLGFLEHDIREMERATGGRANYFRKLIRLALAEGPPLQTRQMVYRGQPVSAQEIAITPYLSDPLRARYAQLAGKRYQFWRSAEVPGRLLGVRTLALPAPPDAAASASGTPARTPAATTSAAATKAQAENAAGASGAPLLTELWLDGAEPPTVR